MSAVCLIASFSRQGSGSDSPTGLANSLLVKPAWRQLAQEVEVVLDVHLPDLIDGAVSHELQEEVKSRAVLLEHRD